MLEMANRSLLDAKQQSVVQHPTARVYLYSRWGSDNDSAIVLDDPGVKRVDITDMVKSAQLTLELEGQSASLSMTLVAEDLPLQVFYNCMVKVFEGYKDIPEHEWMQTFTGFHMGQPGGKGSSDPDFSTDAEDMFTSRESDREINITFQSRDILYNQMETTSQGAWRPQENPNNAQIIDWRYHESITTDIDDYRKFDDLGMIVREIAINDVWGMGLKPEEVSIGTIGYRIQKKLQVVAQNVWSGIKDLLYTMHLVPYFTGAGVLSFRSYDLQKSPVRIYDDGTFLGAIDQSAGALEDVNVVVATGLDDEMTEVKHQRQRMAKLTGTAGWFTLNQKSKHRWAQDSGDTMRVRNGKLRDISVNGIFGNIGGDITITAQGPFAYRITVDMGHLKLVLLMLSLGLLVGMKALQAASAANFAGAGTGLAGIASAVIQIMLFIMVMLIISEIGTWQCEIWGEPYEFVYKELRAEARLVHFGAEAQGLRRFAYEDRKHTVDNKIFSSLDDEALADGSTNRGLRNFARRELQLKLAMNARRMIQIAHDILLEPGDVVEDSKGRRYFLTSIGRNVGRFAGPTMDCQAFRIL